MKIRIGGKVDLKIMAKAYEPVTAEATFEIEIGDSNIDDTIIDDLEKKVRERLEKQLKEYAKIALKQYKYTRDNLQDIMDGHY